MCYDSVFSEYPGLPDMKQISIQMQRAESMEASKLITQECATSIQNIVVHLKYGDRS